MSKMGVIVGISTAVVIVAVIGIFVGTMGVNVSNQEIGLRNAYNSELDHNKMVKNKTWKVVQHGYLISYFV